MYISLGVPPRRLGQLSPEAYAALDPQAKAIVAKVAAAAKAIRGVSGLRRLHGLGQATPSNRLLDYPLGWFVFWGHVPVWQTPHSVFTFAQAVRQGQGTEASPTTPMTSPANPKWKLSDEATGVARPPAETGAGYQAPGGDRNYSMTGWIFGHQYPVLVVNWGMRFRGMPGQLNITPAFHTPGLDGWLMWNTGVDPAHYGSAKGWILPDPASLNADEQFLYKLLLLDNILLNPSADEQATLSLLNKVDLPTVVATAPTLAGWMPVSDKLKTLTVGDSLYIVKNLDTYQRAMQNYPWPGGNSDVRGFYARAWSEGSGAIVPAILRPSPLLSDDEARTAITAGMLSDWNRVTDRVGGLAHQEAKAEARESQQFVLTISVFGLVMGAITGGVLIPAIISAATKTLSTVETARLKSDLANLSNSMQTDSPGFASEVDRVGNLIAAKEAAAAAAAAPAVAPGAQVEMLASTTTSHTGLYIGIAVAGVAVIGGALFLVLRKKR